MKRSLLVCILVIAGAVVAAAFLAFPPSRMEPTGVGGAPSPVQHTEDARALQEGFGPGERESRGALPSGTRIGRAPSADVASEVAPAKVRDASGGTE
jgi:hypothetical protein